MSRERLRYVVEVRPWPCAVDAPWTPIRERSGPGSGFAPPYLVDEEWSDSDPDLAVLGPSDGLIRMYRPDRALTVELGAVYRGEVWPRIRGETYPAKILNAQKKPVEYEYEEVLSIRRGSRRDVYLDTSQRRTVQFPIDAATGALGAGRFLEVVDYFDTSWNRAALPWLCAYVSWRLAPEVRNARRDPLYQVLRHVETSLVQGIVDWRTASVVRRELRDRLALELSSLAQHSTHAERRNTVQNVAAYWQGLRRCKGAPTYTKEEIWRLVAPQIPWPEILSRTTSVSWNAAQLDPKRIAAVTP